MLCAQLLRVRPEATGFAHSVSAGRGSNHEPPASNIQVVSAEGCLTDMVLRQAKSAEADAERVPASGG